MNENNMLDAEVQEEFAHEHTNQKKIKIENKSN
jgi:hypothetical protein